MCVCEQLTFVYKECLQVSGCAGPVTPLPHSPTPHNWPLPPFPPPPLRHALLCTVRVGNGQRVTRRMFPSLFTKQPTSIVLTRTYAKHSYNKITRLTQAKIRTSLEENVQTHCTACQVANHWRC